MQPGLRISRVHAGFLDPIQPGAEGYLALGFDLTLPADARLAGACGRLHTYFKPENYHKVPIPEFVSKALSAGIRRDDQTI